MRCTGIKKYVAVCFVSIILLVSVTSCSSKTQSMDYYLLITGFPPLDEDKHDVVWYFVHDFDTGKTEEISLDGFCAPVASNNGRYILLRNTSWKFRDVDSGIVMSDTIALVSKTNRFLQYIDPSLGYIFDYCVDNNGIVYLILEKRSDKGDPYKGSLYDYDVYMIDFNERDRKFVQLTDDGIRKRNLIVDDDGLKLAYSIKSDRGEKLICLDLKTKEKEVLMESEEPIFLSPYQWIGDKILMYEGSEGIRSGYVLLDSKTKEKRIIDDRDDVACPNFSPNHNIIAYGKGETEWPFDMYVKYLDTDDEVQITDTPDIDECCPYWIEGDISEFKFLQNQGSSKDMANPIYVNGKYGFCLEFPESWKGYFFIREGEDDLISIYFTGESGTSQGYIYLGDKVRKDGDGLLMFYIGPEKAFDGPFFDSVRKIGTVNGTDFYYATGTDYPVGDLYDAFTGSWITDENERELAKKDFRKAQEMEKDVMRIFATFNAYEL